MPTSKNILFGYQFKSIAGAAPVIGPILAIQWGWLPALLWILPGAFFIGWVHDYSSAVVAMRNEGASFGGLSHKLISPRARIILLCFIYFLPASYRGCLWKYRRQCSHRAESCSHGMALHDHRWGLGWTDDLRWKKDIILTTIVTVVIALLGIVAWFRCPFRQILGLTLPIAKLYGQSLHLSSAILLLFCRSGGLHFLSTMLPLTLFSWGYFFGIIGIFMLHPNFTLPAYTGFSHQDWAPLADHCL